MRLHIGMLCPKQFLRPIDSQLLDFVGILAPAVIPLPRIPLRILIRENRPHSLQYGLRDQVLRRYQLQPSSLPPRLITQQFRNSRINSIQRPIHPVISIRSSRHRLVPKMEGHHLTPQPGTRRRFTASPRRCRFALKITAGVRRDNWPGGTVDVLVAVIYVRSFPAAKIKNLAVGWPSGVPPPWSSR